MNPILKNIFTFCGIYAVICNADDDSFPVSTPASQFYTSVDDDCVKECNGGIEVTASNPLKPDCEEKCRVYWILNDSNNGGGLGKKAEKVPKLGPKEATDMETGGVGRIGLMNPEIDGILGKKREKMPKQSPKEDMDESS